MNKIITEQRIEALVVGAILALIGLLGTVCWDIWKRRQEASERDSAVVTALITELNLNKKRLSFLADATAQELQILPQNMTITTPFPEMKTGLWSIVQVDTPAPIMKKRDLLSRIVTTYGSKEELNFCIHSRENYRIANGAMSNLKDVLRSYDTTIQKYITILGPAVDECISELEKN